MIRSAVLALIVTALGACAHAPERHPRDPIPGRDTFLRMERTECLGPCPIYSVTLYPDGAARYHGRRDTLRGTRWRSIESTAVARLMDEAFRIPRWICVPERVATDYPQSIITVSRGGQWRRIVHDHGDPCAPQTVIDLEAAIDLAGGHPQLVPYVR